MIKSYMVVRASSPDDLARQVSDLLSRGWIPQGGVSVTNGYLSNTFIYVQALINES